MAINLIVQHIQDILNGDICKWQRSAINGRALKRAISEQSDLHNGASNSSGKRVLLEPSCRPHWDGAGERAGADCTSVLRLLLLICTWMCWQCQFTPLQHCFFLLFSFLKKENLQSHSTGTSAAKSSQFHSNYFCITNAHRFHFSNITVFHNVVFLCELWILIHHRCTMWE